MRLHFLLPIAAILLSVGIAFAQEPATMTTSNEKGEKFDPSRDPFKDLEIAVTEARKSGRRIILDVGGEWCSWCHKLDKFFSTEKDVPEFLNTNYVVVKVNYSKENKNEKFLSQFPKAEGFPHLYVLEKDGTFLHSQNTGELEAGAYYDREKVLSFLKKWVPAS